MTKEEEDYYYKQVNNCRCLVKKWVSYKNVDVFKTEKYSLGHTFCITKKVKYWNFKYSDGTIDRVGNVRINKNVTTS